MNETFGLFLENILPVNMVLIYSLGVLVSLLETDRVRPSLIKGVKFAFAILFAGIFGWIIVDSIGIELEFLAAWVFFLVSLGVIIVLQYLGELKGKFYGLPKLLLFLPTLVGFQWLILERNLVFSEMMVTVFANGLGFYVAFVLIATIKEQMRISEASDIFKLAPAILIGLGIAAMGVSGFSFLY
ncbi:MAG: Rnf-Nqr domain containing protein [Bacillota bacterium]